MYTLQINGKSHNVEAASDTPLLWVLRDHLGMTGTKFGCGIAQCGACTVHVDGEMVRACQYPLDAVGESEITTIEGLSPDSAHPLQQEWVALDVPQCGYCQSGMLMAAVALLKNVQKPTDDDIDAHMINICRCGTYPRIRQAIHRAAATLKA